MQVPRPSRQHSLAGLWHGVYGIHGLEVVTLGYDFSGRSARIVCTKVTGDDNMPAGQESWVASASPLPQPWSDFEQMLVINRSVFVDVDALAAGWAAPAAAGGGGQAAGVDIPGGAAVAPALAAAGGAAVEPAPAPAAAPAHGIGGGQFEFAAHPAAVAPDELPSVVAIHQGLGQVALAGHVDAEWVEGRLFVYDNGSLGFLWLDTLHVLIDYRRVDAGLLPPLRQTPVLPAA